MLGGGRNRKKRIKKETELPLACPVLLGGLPNLSVPTDFMDIVGICSPLSWGSYNRKTPALHGCRQTHG